MDRPSGSDQPVGAIAGEQREALLRTKLTALVRDLRSQRPSTPGPSHTGSSVGDLGRGVAPQIRGALTGMVDPDGEASVLVEFGTPQAIAGAISWAANQGCRSLTIFVDLDGATAARYASYFGSGATPGPVPVSTSAPASTSASAPTSHAPDMSLSAITVRAVSGASSVGVTPERLPDPIESPEPPEDLIDIMTQHGLEIVSEHGVIRGEILGLEVARLVRWPVETGGDGELHLEVGVGRFDRDAIWAVRAGTNIVDALADTTAMVRKYRRPGAEPHPLGRLRRERWLRAAILQNPGLVGASTLDPVGMTVEAAGMKDSHPSGSVGRDVDGNPLVVVTSVGVDLSVMPLAADLRASFDESARLVVAVPPSDVHPILGRLASMLTPNAQIVPVPTQW